MNRLTRGIAFAFALSAISGCRLVFPAPDLAPDDIESSLFLIGDAGEPDPRGRSKVLDSMSAQMRVAPQKSVAVFLGDNVYPNGIPEEGRAEFADARRRLQVQVDAIPAGVRTIFIPGNHDWAGSGPFGLYAVRLQEQMLAGMARGRDIRMLPGNGCPGPVSFDLGDFVSSLWTRSGGCMTTSCGTTPRSVRPARVRLPQRSGRRYLLPSPDAS